MDKSLFDLSLDKKNSNFFLFIFVKGSDMSPTKACLIFETELAPSPHGKN